MFGEKYMNHFFAFKVSQVLYMLYVADRQQKKEQYGWEINSLYVL